MQEYCYTQHLERVSFRELPNDWYNHLPLFFSLNQISEKINAKLSYVRDNLARCPNLEFSMFNHTPYYMITPELINQLQGDTPIPSDSGQRDILLSHTLFRIPLQTTIEKPNEPELIIYLGEEAELSLKTRSSTELLQAYSNLSLVVIKNNLAERYAHLVDVQAKRIHRKLPPKIELDDLRSAGILGLFDALNNYIPEVGVKFETYAPQRIRGSILDYLRGEDPLTRNQRSISKVADGISSGFYGVTGYDLSDESLAREMNIIPEKLKRILAANNQSKPMSLDATCSDSGDRGSSIIETLKYKSLGDPEEIVSARETIDYALECLTEREALVINLHYFGDMIKKEIAEMLNLSPSAIGQICKRAILKMRNTL